MAHLSKIAVKNIDKKTSLVDEGKIANTFLSRLKGLLGSPSLENGDGLLLKNEKSIHTLFMGFPIDVLYLDQNNCVIKIDADMPPYRLGAFVLKAESILEVPAGTAKATNTVVGDKLAISEF